MECTSCGFQAWGESQLASHVTWHSAGALREREFKCHVCPCSVADLNEFKFHLQFHKQDSKGKFFQCTHCSFRSNVEQIIDRHHKSEHAVDGTDSSDDEDGSYIVKKFKVTFHNGKFHCPSEGCAENAESLSAMMEHHLSGHGAELDGRYLVDFCAQSDQDVHNEQTNSEEEHTAITSFADSAYEEIPGLASSAMNGRAVFMSTTANDDSMNSDIHTVEPVVVQPEAPEDEPEIVGENNGGGISGGISFDTEFPLGSSSVATELFESMSSALGLDLGDVADKQNGLLQSRFSGRSIDMNTPENVPPEEPYNTSLTNDQSDRTEIVDIIDGGIRGEFDNIQQIIETNQDESNPALSLTDIKTEEEHIEPMNEEENATDRFHCDMCEFITANHDEFVEHIKSVHDIEVVSFDDDTTNTGTANPPRNTDGPKRPLSHRDMACTICPYVTNHKRNFRKHMDIHAKVEAYSGPAFKCGYCPYMAMSKGPGCNHVRNLHPDKPFKLYFVEKVGKKILNQQEVPMNKAVFAMEKGAAKATKVSPTPAAKKYVDNAVIEIDESTSEMSVDIVSPGEYHMKRIQHKAESPPKDNDWLVELTKDEAAFCTKLAGMMKYQCRLCDYMDENCGRVRVHYVREHPEHLPVLCGYCRERCELNTFRLHNQSCHPNHPVKVIRQVLFSDTTTISPLEILPGEIEIEEVIDDQGLNDWTAAMRDFVVMETSGTYRCTFCNYKQYGTSALKRHVFPIHFKCYPYICQYCKIGMTQVNQLKNHIEKMHPSLPIRVRRPLAAMPSDDEIERVRQNTEQRPITDTPKTLTFPNSTQNARQPSPVRASPTRYISPSPSSLATPNTQTESLFLDPNTIKQEMGSTDYSPRSGEGALQMSPGSGERREKGMRKTFQCHYCQHSSKWTGRDVQRHILTTHLGLKLFNCVYCEFGCYSRGRLEAHCIAEHPNKPFKVSNLDKRINSVQVVRETPDGVDILALFKPNGEPVLTLDPSKKAQLRKFTLSGKYQAMTRPQDGKVKDPNATAKNILNRFQGCELSPEEKGKLMKPTVKENPKQAWRCKLCELVLARADRIKYHIICHHWKLRPYMCPVCDTYKFQREPVLQHMREEHPGCTKDPINVCDARFDELNSSLERIDNPEEAAQLTGASKQIHAITKQQHSTAKPKTPPKAPPALPIRKDPYASQYEEAESPDDEEGLAPEELWQCLELQCGFVGPYQPVQNHVLQKHMKTQVYLCDFCAAMRNEIERMVEHLRLAHPSMPQRFSHAYGKYKAEVDTRIGRLTQVGANGTIHLPTPTPNVLPTLQQQKSLTTPVDLTIPDPLSPTPQSQHSGSGRRDSMTSQQGSLTSPGQQQVWCPVCKLKLKNQADLDWHLAEEHTQYVKYQCGYCDVVSESKGTLKEHMIAVHSEKPPEYSMVRSLPVGMTAQPVTHAHSPNAGSKLCKMCGFVTQSLAILNDHLETKHLSQVLFQCKLCQGLHKTKDDLMTHYGVLHKDDSLQYKVVPLGAEDEEEEGSEATQDEDLTSLENGAANSMQVEDGMEMYECEECAYATTNHADYKRHLVSHSKQRRASQDSLSSVGKAAKAQQLSDSESRTSSPGPNMFVNRYECRYCTYITRECVSIRRHVMSHINYYPYKCRYCDVSSIRSNAVKTHMMNIHKDATSSPLMVRDTQLEEKIHAGINKIYGDTPKRILKKNAPSGYLPPLSQTMNAPSQFARGGNHTTKAKQEKTGGAPVVKKEPGTLGEDEEEGEGGKDGQKKGIKYVCRICKYVVYGVSQNIRRHVMIHFNYKKYKCPYCEFATIQSHGVTQHISTAHPGFTPRYLTFSQNDLEKKIAENIIKAGDNNISSALSGKTKPSPVMQVVQNITKKYMNNSTINIIRSKAQLGVSKKKKYDIDPSKIPPGRLLYYKCKICNFTENSSLRKCTNMRRHVMSHLDYKRYACSVCDFASTTTCMTKAHIRRRHPGVELIYHDNKDERMEKAMRANIIKVGGKPYTTYTYQDSGMANKVDLTPTPERPFPRFSVQPKPMPVMNPERSGDGNYQCLICNRHTLNGTTMKRHIASHFNYRRYGCPYCELLFTQSTFVLNHVRAKHLGCRLYYMDNKIDDIEEKIKNSWVNLKELETLKSPGTGTNSDSLVSLQQPSKLKLLLTKQKPAGLAAMGESGSEADLNFIEGEASELDYGMYNSEFLNGDDEQSVGAESGNTIDYSDSPGSMLPNESQPDFSSGSTAVNGYSQQNGNAVPVAEQFTGTYYRCVRCSYTTEHKTSMLRHIMWKIGYKPYRCPHCGFQDVLVNGLRKHCLRKHKGMSQTPLLCKDAEKEYETETLMEQSTINPSQAKPVKRDAPASIKLKVVPPKKIKTEPGVAVEPRKLLVPPKKIKTEPGVAVEPRKLPVTKQLFTEPIDEKIIYRSQIKLQCQLCGKKSSSRGYIYNHVLRHGPPRLKCGYCTATMYFPREAKSHTQTKHPGEALNIKRLWGNRTWDHKNEGIERASAKDVAEVKENKHIKPEVEEEIPAEKDDAKPRLPKPPNVVIDPNDFEETIIERTPVKIPKRNRETGFYHCVYCDYSTPNPNHIKCHMLVHEPPHWRCDRCRKRFVMLYKLRKHTALLHRLPLRYTNLVTGETCLDDVLNYAGAVLESPARSSAHASASKRPSSRAPVINSNHSVQQPVFNMPTIVTGSQNEEEDPMMAEATPNDSDVDMPDEYEEELILDCHLCRYRTYSEAELIEHLGSHRNVLLNGDGEEFDEEEGIDNPSHLHPSVVIEDFLKLPIEDLHALMVEHGLEEIHQ